MNFAVKSLAASLCAVAFVCAAPMASAATVTLHFNGFQDYGGPGSAGNAVNVQDTAKSIHYTGTGGAFSTTELSESGGANFFDSAYKMGDNIITWCVELAQYINFGAGNAFTYTLTGQDTNTASLFTNLEKLFNQFMAVDSINNITSTAMQLAVWEVTHETQNSKGGGFGLETGSFTANTSGTNTDAYTLAQSWLVNLNDKVSSKDQGYRAILLLNDHAQNQLAFVKPSEVPLPGAALMFLSALGLGGLARRKSSAQMPAAA